MSEFVLRGPCWVLGDRIDTDVLAPGPYMKQPLPVLAAHCLEAVDASFAGSVQPGEIIVAGEGFGIGSSREQAVQVLIELGIAAIVARSFARIFYRNALNLGLPALTCETLKASRGELLEVDVGHGIVHNLARGERHAASPIPAELLEIVAAGGLLPWLAGRQHG